MIDNELIERLVLSFESIAQSLAAIHETGQKFYEKLYGAKKQYKEPIVSRVPSLDDRIREQHGASSRPIEDWLSDITEENEEEFIGDREKEFLLQKLNASPKAIQESGQSGSGPDEAWG